MIYKVGIIGYGKMGKLRHRIIATYPDLRVTAICDVEEHAEAPGKDICFFTDYRQLLKADLDIVFVCTPNSISPAIVVAALQGKKHVFCEKPPGRTRDDVQAMIRAEKSNPGLKLKFGFNHRYHEIIKETKSIIDSGVLGDILWMRGVYGKAGSQTFEKEWRNDPAISGGGILLDQGIHMVDLCRYFAGEFKDISAMITRSYWNIDVEDNAFVLMKTDSNKVAMLHSSATHWKHTFRLEIFLKEGYLILEGILSQTNTYGQGKESLKIARKRMDLQGKAFGNPKEEVIYFTQDTSWEMEIDEFINCIKADTAVRQGASWEAYETMDLVQRIYEADASWKPVSLKGEEI